MARVRPRPEHADVMFFELARICRLRVSTPGYEDAVRRLEAAAETGATVRVRFVVENGDVIEAVS